MVVPVPAQHPAVRLVAPDRPRLQRVGRRHRRHAHRIHPRCDRKTHHHSRTPNCESSSASPTEFFDPKPSPTARAAGAVSGLVVGRVGFGTHPDTDDTGAILGGRLIHLVRDTPWGAALRSHFFLGQDLPAAGLTPEVIAKEITDDFGPALLQHAYNEFTFLSKFLPSLYLGENRDKLNITPPW